MGDDDEYDDDDKEKYDKLFTSFIPRKSISINTSDLKNKHKINNNDSEKIIVIVKEKEKEKKKGKEKEKEKGKEITYNEERKKRKILEHSLSDEEIEKIRNGHKKCYIRKICEYMEKDNEEDRKELQDCMNKIVECLKKDQLLPVDPEGKCHNDSENVDKMFDAITQEITDENFADILIWKRLFFWLTIGLLSPSFRSFLCPVNSQPLVDVEKFTNFVDEKKNPEFFSNLNNYNASRINEVQFIVNCYKLWLDTNPDYNIDVYKGTTALDISDEHLIVSGKHLKITDKNKASSLYLLPAPEPKSHSNNNKEDQKKKEKEKEKVKEKVKEKEKEKKKEKEKEKKKEKEKEKNILTTISDS